MKKLLSLIALTSLVFSCEPIEIDDNQFDPNDGDTTTVAGMSITMTTANKTFVQNSIGVGFSCADSAGTIWWGLATGDSVFYDPMANAMGSGMQDSTLLLMWYSSSSGPGTYTMTNSIGFPARCSFITPTSYTDYDASGVTVNITKLTNDSIVGNYGGQLLEIILQLDSLGNLVPIYTGQIDTVQASFSVFRAPC